MYTLSNELQLPDIEILKKEEIDGILHYKVSTTNEPDHCPFCHFFQISKYGTSERVLIDAPNYTVPVTIHVTSHRYLCPLCGKTFAASIPFAEPRAKVTNRLKEQIEKYCLRKSVTELAEDYNISVATVSRITDNYVAKNENAWTNYTPEVLALVNVKLGKNTRVLCVDTERNGIVDLLEKADKASLITTLKNRFDFEQIKTVVIDFNRSHCNALKAASDYVQIVIDKYYVLMKAIDAIKSELRGIDSGIEALILKNPLSLTQQERDKLKKALNEDSHMERIYKIKNMFYEMYERNSSASADNVLETIRNLVKKDDIYLYDFLKLIKEFDAEIFNYFSFNYSFSSIQSAKQLVKKVEKKGAGFSYKNLRARLLYGFSIGRATTTTSSTYHSTMPENAIGFFTATSYKERTHTEFLGNYAYIDSILGMWNEEDYCQ